MFPVAIGLLAGLLPHLEPLPFPQGIPPPTQPPRTGGSSQPLPTRLDYPLEADVDKFAPFIDAIGQPIATECAAAGAADLDADGNMDLWFLSASTASYGMLSVQMARTSSLGPPPPNRGAIAFDRLDRP